MKEQKKVVFSDILIMRPILILSIIVGHAFTIYTGSKYWPLPAGCSHIQELSWVNPTSISFALQAFVFISGYLYAYKKTRSSEIDAKDFIQSKLKRIYLPSIIFSILYILIFSPKAFAGATVIYDILNGAGHLWFLPMLFWCYVWGYILLRRFDKISVGIIALLVSLSLVSIVIPDYFRLSKATHYFIYYIIGYWTFQNKTSLLDYFSTRKYLVILSWLIIAILCSIKVYLSNSCLTLPYLTLLKTCVNVLLGLIGSLTLFVSINLTTYIKNRTLNIRSDVWYGMYIYHQFIMMYLYYHTKVSIYLGNFTPYIVLIVTILTSYALVLITLRTKIGRYLIG